MLSPKLEIVMAKLTDTQLILLSTAAQRDDGAAVLPERMNRGSAMRAATALLARKLMREIRAKPGMPVWRTDEKERPLSLVIMKAGREVIGVEAVEEAASAQVSGGKIGDKPSDERAAHASPDRAPRPGSKQAQLVAMLSAPKGATLGQLVQATGWLPHTTRAALTGLRKRGFAIERAPDDKLGSVYRIVGEQTQAAA
jgi:hypothetical protein